MQDKHLNSCRWGERPIIINNVRIYTKDQRFVPGCVQIVGDRIGRVFTGEKYQKLLSENTAIFSNGADFSQKGKEKADSGIINGKNAYLIPGMIDLHFHGCLGYDVCDGTQEALQKIAEYELSIGVTSICPATMTLRVEELEQILSNAAVFRKKQLADEPAWNEPDKSTDDESAWNEPNRSPDNEPAWNEAAGNKFAGQKLMGASLVGLNMEGPFISRAKRGAQAEKYIIPCDTGIYHRFQKASKGLIKFIGVAPEEEGALPFIREIKEETGVSLAHTNADYETAKAAFRAGAGHVVHLYNAMSAYTHREPGVVGAAADSSHVEAELICDGIHVHPSVVRNTFRMFGKDRIILISDSMRAAGMPDGIYTLGGQEVRVRGSWAKLVRDGTIAGSVTTLPDCVRTAVKKMKIPLGDAVAAATINPARSLGLDQEYGSIEEGKKADLVLWREDLSLAMVIKSGNIA